MLAHRDVQINDSRVSQQAGNVRLKRVEPVVRNVAAMHVNVSEHLWNPKPQLAAHRLHRLDKNLVVLAVPKKNVRLEEVLEVSTGAQTAEKSRTVSDMESVGPQRQGVQKESMLRFGGLLCVASKLIW